MTSNKLSLMNKAVLMKETKLKNPTVLKLLPNTTVWLKTITELPKNAHKTENMLKVNSTKPLAEFHSLTADFLN
jgi:hypothetical protein